MSTKSEVISNWREFSELMVLVRQVIGDQQRKLNSAIDANAGPTPDQVERIEELQLDLAQVEQAYEEAELKAREYERAS